MANNTRRRLSFVDLAHPQVWNKLLQYSQVTLTLTELITDFTNQWANICLGASIQLEQLVHDFRKKTELEVQSKCHLGGMMYDLWESLLLESEIESQSLKRVAVVMQKKISLPLRHFRIEKSSQLKINEEYHRDLNDILKESHDIVQQVQNRYSKIYHTQGVSPDYHCVHNEYVLELAGVNSLYSKYQYQILPQLLQGMEQAQLQTIETICQNIQLMASIFQEYHEQRQSSYASFVVTSTRTDPNEELETYICSMNESTNGWMTTPVQIQFESFVSPLNNNTTTTTSRSQPLSNSTNEQLIIYAAPVIQMHLSSRCKETIDRLREIKKEKSLLLAIINPSTSKLIPMKQRDEQQHQSDKKILQQMSDLLKRKHQLRLIELEESVLLAQQDLLQSHRPSMSSMAENEQETTMKRGSKNIKGLWRDAFRALKTSTTTSGTADDENRSVPPATPGRIRSHSLKPQHSRIDYARRKSAADVSSTILSCWESTAENNLEDIVPKTPSPSWFKRRFTLLSLEQPPIDDKRRMTTGRLSIFDEKSYADLLKEKRPSLIAQMVESFVRRISSRKKKRNSSRDREREEDQPVIDPVYETLKVAAETRKRTLAIYLQQRQESLNKQTSLTSQGSSEFDIQPSPNIARRQDSTSAASSSSQPQAMSTPSSDNARLTNN